MFDIYLYKEAVNRFDIILSKGLRSLRRRLGWFPPEKEREPVVAASLFHSLVDRYGTTMGTEVFQKMYQERKGPFGEDAKYDPDKPKVARKIERAGGVIPPEPKYLGDRGFVMPKPKRRR
jgi:hypothetical protein